MKYRINIDYKNEHPLDYESTYKIARGVFEKLKRSSIDLSNSKISYKNIQKITDRIEIRWDASHPNNAKRKKKNTIEYGKYAEYLSDTYISEPVCNKAPKYMVNYYTWNYHIIDYEVTEDFIYPIPKYLNGVIDINFLFVPDDKIQSAIDLARIYSSKYYKYTFIFNTSTSSIETMVKLLTEISETIINILNKKFVPLSVKEIFLNSSVKYWISTLYVNNISPQYILLNKYCAFDKRKENDNVVISENEIKGKKRKAKFNNL